MNDLTLLYYTANRIDEFFANNIRHHLLQLLEGKYPIISVSQKPLDFGENICVGDIGYSTVNVYKQILAGAKLVKTKYIGCCEDDTLYNMEHFRYRHSTEAFVYNSNNYRVLHNCFCHKRNRKGMYSCIVPTELLIKTLEYRFSVYPNGHGSMGFGEPGRFERYTGLPPVPHTGFYTSIPILTFSHRPSLSGISKFLRTDRIENSLPDWGKAEDLWKRMHG